MVSISTDELASSGAERMADLWETYNHRDGFAGARRQYEAELLNYKRLNHGANQPCPCRNDRKYRHCHKSRIVQVGGLITKTVILDVANR